MAALRRIDITRLVDDRRLNWFNWQVVLACFFVAIADGYDISAAAFAGPSLVKAWHIQSMASLGPAFSASLFGIFFGSPIFGWLGDRFGRKRAIIASCLVIGVFTLLCARAASLDELIYLRFLAGIGIGGMLPNIVALNAEYAPKRFRATLIIIMFTGVTFGASLPGPIAAWMLPTYGWPIIFIIGGLLPLATALGVSLAAPESLKFLMLRAHNIATVRKILRRLEPTLAIDDSTEVTLTAEPRPRTFHPGLLFGNGLAAVTALLWVMFVCNQLAFYFVNSWLPTVLVQASIPLAHAAMATTLFQIGGTVGGLVLSRPLDRHGFGPVAILFVVAIPTTMLIGYASVDETLLMLVVFASGFSLLGLQFGLNAASAMIYPTAFRSSGSGWAFAVARLGAVAGPILAGYLIASHMPIQSLFLVLGIPLAIGLAAAMAMTGAYQRRFARNSMLEGATSD